MLTSPRKSSTLALYTSKRAMNGFYTFDRSLIWDLIMASQDAKKDPENDRDIEVFKMVTSHFRQDLREFWNRANFYLLTNAGLFSAFLIIYPALIKDHLLIVVIVPLLGITIATFWYFVLRGAFHWIEQWRAEVIRLSEELDRFQCYAKIESSVKQRRSLSPSYLTRFLPIVFMIAWIMILASVLIEIF